MTFNGNAPYSDDYVLELEKRLAEAGAEASRLRKQRDDAEAERQRLTDKLHCIVSNEWDVLTARLAEAEAENERLRITLYSSGDDDGRNHFEIEAAKGGRDE